MSVAGKRRAASEERRRLLDGGHPIEAYCVLCDDFWSISAAERVALASEVLG